MSVPGRKRNFDSLTPDSSPLINAIRLDSGYDSSYRHHLPIAPLPKRRRVRSPSRSGARSRSAFYGVRSTTMATSPDSGHGDMTEEELGSALDCDLIDSTLRAVTPDSPNSDGAGPSRKAGAGATYHRNVMAMSVDQDQDRDSSDVDMALQASPLSQSRIFASPQFTPLSRSFGQLLFGDVKGKGKEVDPLAFVRQDRSKRRRGDEDEVDEVEEITYTKGKGRRHTSLLVSEKSLAQITDGVRLTAFSSHSTAEDREVDSSLKSDPVVKFELGSPCPVRPTGLAHSRTRIQKERMREATSRMKKNRAEKRLLSPAEIGCKDDDPFYMPLDNARKPSEEYNSFMRAILRAKLVKPIGNDNEILLSDTDESDNEDEDDLTTVQDMSDVEEHMLLAVDYPVYFEQNQKKIALHTMAPILIPHIALIEPIASFLRGGTPSLAKNGRIEIINAPYCRPKHMLFAQRLPGQHTTSNLHRRSPTSLLPLREKRVPFVRSSVTVRHVATPNRNDLRGMRKDPGAAGRFYPKSTSGQQWLALLAANAQERIARLDALRAFALWKVTRLQKPLILTKVRRRDGQDTNEDVEFASLRWARRNHLRLSEEMHDHLVRLEAFLGPVQAQQERERIVAIFTRLVDAQHGGSRSPEDQGLISACRRALEDLLDSDADEENDGVTERSRRRREESSATIEFQVEEAGPDEREREYGTVHGHAIEVGHSGLQAEVEVVGEAEDEPEMIDDPPMYDYPVRLLEARSSRPRQSVRTNRARTPPSYRREPWSRRSPPPPPPFNANTDCQTLVEPYFLPETEAEILEREQLLALPRGWPTLAIPETVTQRDAVAVNAPASRPLPASASQAVASPAQFVTGAYAFENGPDLEAAAAVDEEDEIENDMFGLDERIYAAGGAAVIAATRNIAQAHGEAERPGPQGLLSGVRRLLRGWW